METDNLFKWRNIPVVTNDGKDFIVHIHLSVVKRNKTTGEPSDIRLLKFTVSELHKYFDALIDYCASHTDNGVYFAIHFLCGCSKKFYVAGKNVSEDDFLDVLCDSHWKQEILSIPAEVYYGK